MYKAEFIFYFWMSVSGLEAIPNTEPDESVAGMSQEIFATKEECENFAFETAGLMLADTKYQKADYRCWELEFAEEEAHVHDV